jgi:ABC-2 type transport system permease protein
MDIKAKKTLNLAIGVVLLGINLVLLNVLYVRSAVRVRVDLTEGQRFTLSPVTRDFLRSLERPVELVFYHSSPRSMPTVVRPLVDPLRDALSEFAVESDGRVTARFVELDVQPEKVRQDVENSYGIRPIPIPVQTTYEDAIKNVYFSVLVTAGDQYEQLPLVPIGQLVRIVPNKETLGVELELTDTEYVLAKAIYKVTQSFDTIAGALYAKDLEATLTFYLSGEDALPQSMKNLGTTMKEVADELAKGSPGRVSLEIKDPWEGVTEPDQRRQIARQLVQEAGIRPIEGPSDDFYSWLLIKVGSEKNVVPLIAFGSELGRADLEETVKSAIQRLLPGFLPTVGIVAPQPAPSNPMMMQRRPPDAFDVTRRVLAESFQVKPVDLSSGVIAEDIQTLLVVQPGDLSDRELYAMDQFLMRGGKIVLCAGGFHLDLQAMSMSRRLSLAKEGGPQLDSWLRHFGIQRDSRLLMDTRASYLPVPQVEQVGFQNEVRFINIKYPFFARIDASGLNDTHPITGSMQSVGLLWASPITLGKVPEGAKGTVLLRSSAEASLTADSTLVDSIIDIGYQPGIGSVGQLASIVRTVWAEVNHAVKNETSFPPPHLQASLDWIRGIRAASYGLGVVVEGTFTSYFADKAIPGLASDPVDDPEDGGAATDPETKPESDAERTHSAPLIESRRPGSLVVFGDSDFVSAMPYQFFQLDDSDFRANLQLIENALAWSSNDPFTQIRNDRQARRPLTAFQGKSPEEREAKGLSATLMTFSITLGAILAVALCWLTYRHTRRPIALFSVTEDSGTLPLIASTDTQRSGDHA